MKPAPEDLADQISTREEMASFLDALSTDAVEHGAQWENLQIFDMLESMAAWLRDTADSPRFPTPDLTPQQWRFIADLMLAGKHYE